MEPHRLERLAAGLGHLGLEPGMTQGRAQQEPDVLLVIDDEDAGSRNGCFHETMVPDRPESFL